MTTPLFPDDIDAFLAANKGRHPRDIEIDFWAEFDKRFDTPLTAASDEAKGEIKNVIERLTP